MVRSVRSAKSALCGLAAGTPTILDAELVFRYPDSDCDDSATYEIVVESRDDLAPPGRLTWYVHTGTAVYSLGERPTEKLLSELRDGRRRLLYEGDFDDEGSDQWVAVRAVDQAGNVSELSEPFPIDSGGCSASGSPGRSAAFPLLAMSLLVLRRPRRR